MNRRPSLLWPSVLIGAGGLLLLDNLQLLPPGLWAALAQLWPMLIIVLGLNILIGRRAALGVSVLLVGGVLVWASLRAQQLPVGETQFTGQAMGEAQSVNVFVDFKMGELTLSALGPSAHLMEAEVRHAPGTALLQTYAVNIGVGKLRLIQQPNPVFIPFLPRTEIDSHWAIQLARAVPLQVDVYIGGGVADLDLSEMQLTTVTVEANGGDTTLRLPADVPLRLTINGDREAVTLPARFSRNGRVFTTANFAPTSAFVEVTLTVNAGQVAVR